ncbi:hydrolase [Bimuria novae-zelandiae CBS 107.79]|uniref:Hydrolase n=1 Tax=Bimuria novae-zelandiae CBS 107.79 TaxID=1447943 RepID=A0A6A5V1K4_9PLEO|nr:hydrolase [Bimuria novae-zelandiae CBS 107.79]
MYGDQYDPSHDYEHIQRVVKYTHELYLAEKKVGHVNPGTNITTMYLGAMMHDVGETKYLEKGRTQEEVVVEKMLECGATPKLANDVATIAVNVSFTREITATDRTRIHAIIEHHPELAFVQDADRLDALGPSGQARCFVYGGANPRRRQQTIHTSIQLHHKRFQYYVPLMKTRSGRVRAEQKWAWMEHHRQEWHEDTDVSTVL